MMTKDSEGFLYPKINEQSCIDCGLCNRVCPIQGNPSPVLPTTILAAYNNNENVRKQSSSGGIFTLLAEKTIAEGGVVFGARFNKDWQVEIAYTESFEGIDAFRGSKYVQATVGNAYTDAKSFLKQGRKVLFSGTPCQISGLNHFLQETYDNLLTVDVVCHGVPSPKVWHHYLAEVTHNAVFAIKSCTFRNKDNGWKRFNFSLEYSHDGKNATISSFHQQNHFMRAFLRNMILRPSCYACGAKEGRSHSDITIADFWGIQNVLPEMDDDLGTGLVFVNTFKGQNIIDSISMTSHPVTIQDAIKDNPCWKESVHPHPKREHFFKILKKKNSIICLIEKELAPQLSFRQYTHNLLIRLELGISARLGGGASKTLNHVMMALSPSHSGVKEMAGINIGWKLY